MISWAASKGPVSTDEARRSDRVKLRQIAIDELPVSAELVARLTRGKVFALEEVIGNMRYFHRAGRWESEFVRGGRAETQSNGIIPVDSLTRRRSVSHVCLV